MYVADRILSLDLCGAMNDLTTAQELTCIRQLSDIQRTTRCSWSVKATNFLLLFFDDSLFVNLISNSDAKTDFGALLILDRTKEAILLIDDMSRHMTKPTK